MLNRYDALLLDLDGTVYRGPVVVEGAPEAVRAAGEHGLRVRYVTNNAARSPETVSAQLRELGLPAIASEVDTSAQAAAALLAESVSEGSAVLVLGSEALEQEIRARGMLPVRDNTSPVTAVVQGLSKELGWPELAEACVAINAGAEWFASNDDPTLPTERGMLPGNGSLIAALRTATGKAPVVAGKPEAPLMRRSIRAAESEAPLVVGDRLDTDIAGARAVGVDSMLVLSGVSGAAELLVAPANQRPDYLAADLRGVLARPEDLAIGEHGDWNVHASAEGLRVSGTGSSLDLLRTLCAVSWNAASPSSVVLGETPEAREAIQELGLGPNGAPSGPIG